MLQGRDRLHADIRLTVLAVAVSLLSACGQHDGPAIAAGGACSSGSSPDDISLFLAGDSIIVKPWSQVDDPAFLDLVAQIRGADVAIANLETVIHEFKGYAQLNAGGTYMASPPEIAAELAWAGFDMVAHANNHTFDYGTTGVLENLEHVGKAGLVLAGSGEDLQRARQPAYFRSPKGTVALVSTTATYTPYGRASISRPELRGRPGANPLEVLWEWNIEALAPLLKFTVPIPATVDPDDLAGNLDAIKAARQNADLVVFSIHAHERDGDWLQSLAHQVIDAGADVFFAHGPHVVDGIEIYRCKPIIYGLGDFVFQQEQITRLPPEYFEELGLEPDTTWEELQALRREQRGAPPYGRMASHEGLGAVLRIGRDGLSDLRLVPVDLAYPEDIPLRGRPRTAGPALGRQIIDDLIEQSRRFGTDVAYSETENRGIVTIR